MFDQSIYLLSLIIKITYPSRWVYFFLTLLLKPEIVVGMKTKTVSFQFWEPFSRFYRLLKLNKNEKIIENSKNGKKKWKWKRKYLSVFRLFSRNIIFLRYSTVCYVCYWQKYHIHVQCEHTLLSMFLRCNIYTF